MKHLIFFLFFLLLMVYPGMAQTVIFSDDFESYDTGTVPGEPWVTRFDGASASVHEAVAFSGIKSFQLESLFDWARVEAIPLDTIYDYLIYEGEVFVSQTDKGCAIGFGFTEQPGTYWGRDIVEFGNDGNIYFRGNNLMAYSAQTWYKVMVYCDFVRNMGKVWIDDVLMLEDAPLSTRDELVDFCIYGNNFASGPSSTVYFDDIKILRLPEFKINSIVDIPNDQGRQVRLSWLAHPYDVFLAELSQVTEYSVWRKIDPQLGLHKIAMTGNWDFITTIPATQDWEYHAVVPTLADSNMNGMYTSTYVVRAHTADLLTHWESDTAIGYSVDNLSPAKVSGAAAMVIDNQKVQLDWNENLEKDFSHYNIYRGESAGFTPGTPLASTSLKTYTDENIEPKNYYYKISAVDFNGNEGEFSDEVAAQITSVREFDTVVKTFDLKQNYPNPFNPLTTIRYALKQPENTRLVIYDALGRIVKILVNERQEAGWYEVKFDASGCTSGTYFYKLTAGSYTKIRQMILIK
jgi:hypothetical protein